MSTPYPDLDSQIACVKRELKLRAAVYPRLVDSRKMSANAAAHEQAAMNGVLATLEALKALAAPRLMPDLEAMPDAQATGG